MDSTPGPDVVLDERRARDVMDRILESIPLEQRAVFILFELEDMTTQEVADALGIPSGTVASRLRRARELFLEQVKRIRARSARTGGP
jgi:RNA polymerase sigma-70 factor (ECF subfamily)